MTTVLVEATPSRGVVHEFTESLSFSEGEKYSVAGGGISVRPSMRGVIERRGFGQEAEGVIRFVVEWGAGSGLEFVAGWLWAKVSTKPGGFRINGRSPKSEADVLDILRDANRPK